MTRRTAVLSAALLLGVGCTDTRTTPVVGLRADNTNLSLNSGNTTLKVGQTQQLSIIHTHNGLAYTGTAVWQSSAAAVASVDTTGLVTAVAPGTASITATNASGEQDDGSVTITVTPNVLTVTGLTWNCTVLFGTPFCLLSGGTITGAPPNSPVSMYAAYHTIGGATAIFGSSCEMVTDANGNVTIPTYPNCTLAYEPNAGLLVFFCPNDWFADFGAGWPGFDNSLNTTPGFAAANNCAGPFIAQ